MLQQRLPSRVDSIDVFVYGVGSYDEQFYGAWVVFIWREETGHKFEEERFVFFVSYVSPMSDGVAKRSGVV